MSVKQLKISPAEAQVIEMCLRSDMEDYRWFLIQVGISLSQNKEVEIGVSEKDLWWLRDKINPLMAGGLDIIIKIYGLLVKFRDGSISNIIELPPKDRALVKRSTSQGSPED